jgi:flagellar biosynthesis chaperone FliJ
MKRFVWRLQKILDVKTKEEQAKQMDLFRLTEMLAEKRSELLMRQRILQEIVGDIKKNRSSGRLGVQEFFLKHAATNDECIRVLQGEIEELETRQKRKMAELLAARRFKEGLERLRAEARERFVREQEKLEQKELDDRTSAVLAWSESLPGQHGA